MGYTRVFIYGLISASLENIFAKAGFVMFFINVLTCVIFL